MRYSTFPLRRFLATLCLAAFAWAAAPAAEGGRELRLAVGTSAVDVFDAKDGRLLQSIPFDEEEADIRNREYFAALEDMNFDGYPDVRILFSEGMVNTYFDCWLWSPGEEEFVLNDEMRELSNPNFDPVSKTISVYERGSAVSHVAGDLAWENGKLVWIAQTVEDIADDNRRVIIRRYLRDYAGALRLIAEGERDADSGGGYPDMDDAYYRPALPGLNLTLDLPADTLDVIVLPDGQWWRRMADPDGTLSAELRRARPVEFGEESAGMLIRTEWPDAYGIAVSPFPALSEKLTYPAFKAEFMDGRNEDAREYVAALVFTDEWSFWFVLDAHADAGLSPDSGADEDATAANARLKRDMEKLLLGIAAADPADGDFLPYFGIPMYLADAESPLPISVLDALVLIRKTAAPEASSGERANIAYRYDGPGTVAGKPSLLFSFGADSWERFDALRHFAVDAEGTVRETKARDDGIAGLWIMIPDFPDDVPGQFSIDRLGNARYDRSADQGALALTVERLKNGYEEDDEFDFDDILEYVAETEKVDQGDLRLIIDVEELSSIYGYPVAAVVYATGEGDAETEHAHVFIFTKDWIFRVHLAVAGDAPPEYAERIRHYMEDLTIRDAQAPGERPPDRPTADAHASEDGATETIGIHLRGNPSTGYFWQWTAGGDGAVRETDVEYHQQENVPGSPATYTHNFVGEAPGEVTLRFIYTQSGREDPGTSVNLYRLRVLPDKRIVMLDMTEDIVGRPKR